MSCCGHCDDAGTFFGKGTARRDLRRYRKKGPLRTTALLLGGLRELGVEGRSLLDVGGGVGAIQHELLAEGLDRAIQVDASEAYLEAARAEAERRGQGARASFHYGDFADLAPELPEVDFVTLDRVVCCYPDPPRLLGAAADRARNAIGLVYPRERFGVGTFLALTNLWLRIRGSEFRVYLHPVDRIRGLMREAGFELARSERTFVWHVELHRRAGPEDTLSGKRV